MNEHELENKLQSAAANIGSIPSIKDSVMSQVAAQAPHPRASSRWSNRFAYARWAVAAAILIVLGLVMWWDKGPTSTGLAWADVQKQVTAANTLVCVLSESTNGDATPHPQKCYLKSPRLVRTESIKNEPMSSSASASQPALPPQINLFVTEGEDQAQIQLYPISSRALQGYRTLRIGSSVDGTNFPLALLQALQQVQSDQVAKVGEQELDGVRTVRFETSLPDSLIDLMKLPRPASGKISVWADTSSGLPVRVEIKPRMNDNEVAVWDHMEWNKPLDDALFEPPTDYELNMTDNWAILCHKEIAARDLKLTIKLDNGDVLASEKDGKATQKRGVTHFYLHADRAKLVQETTASHIGETLIVSIGDYTIRRKIKYPLATIVIDCYLPGSPATTRAVTTEASSQAASAPPSKLDFRIAQSGLDGMFEGRLSTAERATYDEWLQQGKIGRSWTPENKPLKPAPEYIWLPFSDASRPIPGLAVGEYQGRKYLLVSDKAEQKVLADQSGREAWGLTRTESGDDGRGHPAVVVYFDEAGRNQFRSLSSNTPSRPLAIIVDGQVASVTYIRGPITVAIIEGNFTDEQAERMAAALKAGMPPVDQASTQPAAP